MYLNLLILTTMKKFTPVLMSMLLLVSTAIFAINPPTVISGLAAWNTATSSGTICLDNFTELTNSSNVFLSYARPITVDPNGYAFDVESRSANPLKEWNGAVATSAELEPIYLKNTGRSNINFFGGYFYNVTTAGNQYQDSLKITIDDYVYIYRPSPNSTFVGFVFTEGFTEVKIESWSDNALAKCPAVSRVYWGSNLPTGIAEQTTQAVIYPNPTADGININTTGTVSIFSTTGQMLLSEEVTENTYLPLTGLVKGVYIVKIETATGVQQEKLIKK